MAGTIVQSVQFDGDNWKCIKFACTADASAGTFPTVTLDSAIRTVIRDWGLYKFQVECGSTAPTVDSDFTLLDANGIDLLGGGGANKITTSDTEGYPVIGTQPVVQPVVSQLSLVITQADAKTNSATFNIFLYFKKPV